MNETIAIPLWLAGLVAAWAVLDRFLLPGARWFLRRRVNRVVVEILPIRLTPMTATCRVPPLSRVKLGIGWSRGVARDAEQ